MSDTMKITVEVEVPSGEYCGDCLFLDDRYGYDGYKRNVDCNLFPNDRKIWTKEETIKKFPSCLAACQKATEQKPKNKIKRIFAIKERCDAATPGPWMFDGQFILQGEKFEFAIAEIQHGFELLSAKANVKDSDAIKQEYDNNQFIVNAREDIPYLLAELERVTAERDALKEANRWIQIDDQLPKNNIRKLVKLLNGHIGIASYFNISKRWLADSGQEIETIICWRPLPEVSESEE